MNAYISFGASSSCCFEFLMALNKLQLPAYLYRKLWEYDNYHLSGDYERRVYLFGKSLNDENRWFLDPEEMKFGLGAKNVSNIINGYSEETINSIGKSLLDDFERLMENRKGKLDPKSLRILHRFIQRDLIGCFYDDLGRSFFLGYHPEENVRIHIDQVVNFFMKYPSSKTNIHHRRTIDFPKEGDSVFLTRRDERFHFVVEQCYFWGDTLGMVVMKKHRG